MTVPGFMRLEGDCVGNDLEQRRGSRRECGKACNQLGDCKGFLYVVSAGKKFNHPPCFLKAKMCMTPVNIEGLDISAYFKTNVEGKCCRNIIA